MTPNTKVGLLVGLVFIIGIGMLLSQQVQPGNNVPGKDLGQLVGEKEKPQPAPAVSPQPSRHDTALAGVDRATRHPAPPGPGGRMVADDPPRPTGPAMTGGVVAPPRDPLADGMRPAAGGDSHPSIPDGVWGPLTPQVPAGVTAGVGPARATTLPPGYQTYKVQAGDSLSAISTKFYQTCKRYDVIFKANQDKLTDASTVREGMELVIPPLPGLPGLAGLPASDPPAVTGGSAVAVAPGVGDLAALGVGIVPAPGAPSVTPVPLPLEAPAPGPTSPVLTPPSGGPSLLDSPLLTPSGRHPGVPIMVPARPSGSVPASATYCVKGGDTLSSIAAAVMGNRGQWRALYDANKDVISDPNHLSVGVVLRVPAARVAME